MPTFRVTIEENASYEVTITAPNKDEAGEVAEEYFLQAENIAQFPCTVHEREVADIRRVRSIKLKPPQPSRDALESFIGTVARMTPYKGMDLSDDQLEDAVVTTNRLIEDARKLLNMKPNKARK